MRVAAWGALSSGRTQETTEGRAAKFLGAAITVEASRATTGARPAGGTAGAGAGTGAAGEAVAGAGAAGLAVFVVLTAGVETGVADMRRESG